MLLRRIILIILFFGSFMIAPQWAHALTRQLPLSGQLLTPAKTAVPDGDYTMRFAIYDKDRTASDPYPSDADSASRIWTETQAVKVERGLWKVVLGSATALPDNLNFEAGNYYLGIRINTDSEMVPRKKILPVPQALNSESVGGAKPGTGNNNILQLDSAGAINIAGNITTAGILQGANLIIGTAIQLPANSILTADIMDGTISTIDLADGVITSVKISDSSITSAKLSDGAITNAKIANDAIGTNHIIDGAVAVSKIADGAITTVKISDGSVATSKINDLAVTTLKIADGAITAAKLADSSITTAKIADTSITAAKLFTGDLHFQNTDTGTTSLTFGLGTGTAVGTNNFSLTASNAANKPAMRYNGSTGKWQISNDGTTFADIGSSLSSSLQAGYDAGNTITTSDGRNILFNLADTATDSNFLINIQGTGNSFQIQDAGTPIFTVADGGLATFGGNINLSGNRIVSASRIDGYASGTFLYTAVDLRSAGSYSSLALDSSNYPHIAYYTSDSSAATIADWDGTQWTVTDFDSAGVRGYNIDLVIDGAGVKHAVYEEQITADSNLIYAKYVGTGGTGCASAAWSCTTVDSTGDVGRGVNSIDVDGSNVPHISYYDTTNGDLKHAWFVGSGGNCSGSTAWSCEIVESANTVGSASSIAINRANGNIHITYYDITNGDLRYIKYSGGAWGVSVILDGTAGTCIAAGCGMRDAGNYSYGSNLVLTASGNPRVAYFDDTADDLYYAYSNDGGTSWTTEKIDGGSGVSGTGCAVSGTYGQYPSLTLDSGGNPHISYYNYSTYDLRYASNNGSAWTCQTLDSTNSVGLYSSIKMTSADKAYISYQDSTNTDLKIVSNNYPKLNIYSDVAIMGETGNLGIGVLQPTERLDVAGNIKATGNISSALQVAATGGFYTTSSGNYIPTIYGGSSASGNFTLSSTSSSTRGNVFINPGGKFTVIGNSIASASIANAGLQITPNYLFIQYRYYNPGTGYTYSGNTGEANSYGGTAFTLVSTVGDMAYFGSYQPFNSLGIALATAGVGGAVTWEYYNGASWVSLAGLSDGTSNLTQDGIVSWTTALALASVNGYSAYWIRANVTTTGYTTAPTANSTIIGQFGTATAPLVASLIQPAGIADSTTWSATGTMLGINTPSSFNGNLMDLKVAGSSKFVVTSSGNVGIGTASPQAPFHLTSATITNQNGASQFYQNASFTQTNTGVTNYGFKMETNQDAWWSDDRVYGIHVSKASGNSGSLYAAVYGSGNEYGLYGNGVTGVYGDTAGWSGGIGVNGKSAGGVGVQAETTDTTGIALKALSSAITSSDLVSLSQNTSAFVGNMLFANMANASGSFTGNFINLQVNGSSKFIINSSGSTGIGIATPSEKLTVLQNAAGTGILGLWDGANNNVVAVADGGGATFKPAAFDAVYRDDGTPAYTDNTAEAKTSGGTAFTLLSAEGASNDEFYIGLDHPFSTIYADIATGGVGSVLYAQYWNGGWSALTLADNTANLTIDGTITFTAPSNWATTLINGATKYWVRLRSPTSTITTAPTAYFISPTSGARLAVYGQSGDTNPTLHINSKGQVSIGDDLAAYKFDVKGSGGATYFGVNTGSGSPMILIGGSAGESSDGSTAGRHTIRFHSSGTEGDFYWNEADDRYYFRDWSDNFSPVIAGMLGLNTATPTAALQVQATSTSSGATTMTASNGATTFSTSVSATINAGDYIIPTTTTGQARSVTVGGTGTGPFTVTPAFSANVTAETFTIYPAITNLTDNSGNTGLFLQGSTRNVGIGTTSPGYKLDVQGAGFIDALTTGSGGIKVTSAITSPELEVAGMIMINGSVNQLTFSDTTPLRVGTYNKTSGIFSEKIRINTNGDFGVGSNSPTSKFQVKGTATSSGATTMTASNGATTFSTSVSATINAGDYIIPTTTTGQARSVTIGGTGTSFTVTPAFSADVTAETFTIYPAITNLTDNSGSTGLFLQGSTRNVGIGTTSPGTKLEVSGSYVTDKGQLYVKGISGNGYIVVDNDNTANESGIIIKSAGTARWYMRTPSNGGNLLFNYTGGTQVMALSATGVGIGNITSPSGNLDIRQIADGNQVIYARRNTDTTPTGNFVQFQNAAGSATLFSVDVDGSVGIGGTPVYRFDVAGTGSLGSVIRLRNTGTATNGLGTQILFAAERTTSGITNVASVSGIITDITQTAYKGALVLSTADNAQPVERARIDNAGNVSFGVNVTGGTTTIDLGGTGTGNAVCHTTQTGTDNEGLVDCTSGPIADYAEMYPVAGGVEYGDVVAVGTKMLKTKDGDNIAQLVKSSLPYQSTTIGIVSNNYGDFTSAGYNIKKEDNPMPVALNGRVPVKVSLENGPIAVGDPLTSSSVPGVAMKATGAGYVIGKALEPFNESKLILVFVSPGWFTPLTGPLVQGGDNEFDTINVGGLATAKDLVVTGLARIKGDLIVEGKVRGDLEVEGVVKTKGVVGGWRSYENHFLSSKFENDFTTSLLADEKSAASWEYHKIKLITDSLAGSKATLDHSFNFKPADDENGASWRFMIKTEHLNDLPNPLLTKEGQGVVRFGLYGDEQNYALIQRGVEPQTIKFTTCLNGECTTTDNIAIDPSLENHNYIIMIKAGEAKLLIDGQEYAKHAANVPADSILHFYEEITTSIDASQSIALDYLGVIVGRYEPF